MVQATDGTLHAATRHESLTSGQAVKASGATTGGFSGFGSSGARVDRYNPIHDDLSRGTVAEDWIPLDPKLQNRMFRIMFNRGAVEGSVVETIAEMCWSDFDLAGIDDKSVLDTYWASKDNVRVDRYLPFVTKEFLVIGRVVIQCILDAQKGIWSDITIPDADYLDIKPQMLSSYAPMIDLLPSPEMQAWAKSTDPRAVEAKKKVSKEFLKQISQNAPVPLDPMNTAYLPRRSFFNDTHGTSFFVRNIPLWGLEKSLINATLTGHRRRAGPITQIAVGSEQWEPTPDQIDALVSAYTAAEEDSVSSTIGTRYDVQFNQIRGSLNEMWKWEDSWAFLQEAKLKMFGVSEQLLQGDMNIDTSTAPTVFLERLKAHRQYVVETFLMQKFFRSLAVVHNFRRRSKAELNNRIIVNDDDHELILPTLIFHKNLDTTADMARADLLEKMEEKGLPVAMSEWNRALGGGEMADRMRSAVQDLSFRLSMMQFQAIKQKVVDLQEGAASTENLADEVKKLREELKLVQVSTNDQSAYDVSKMSTADRRRARDVADGVVESSVYVPQDTTIVGSGEHDALLDRAQANRDINTLNVVGKAV